MDKISSPIDVISYKHIIFDFDGVIADTNSIRIDGFALLFQEYPEEHVKEMVRFASINGGLSRYKKIRYFFEDVRKESITEEKVKEWANRYSVLVKQKVIEAPSVEGALEFIARYHQDHTFAIISGSDQEELQDVCRQRGIDQYFIEILGSPLSKEINLQQLLDRQQWPKEECIFIGDSINDLNAVSSVGVEFIGRNSGMEDWKKVDGVLNFDSFKELMNH